MYTRRIITTLFMGMLFVSHSGRATYLSGVESGFQGVYHGNSDYTSSMFLSVVHPLYQNKRYLLFTDIRLSQNNKVNQGLHFGLAARYEHNAVKYGIYGFYDVFNTKAVLTQYVAGLEILSQNFNFRVNAYYPYGFGQISNAGMKGFEEDVEIKMIKNHPVFLALKKYNFMYDIAKVDGYGIDIKYDGKRKASWNVRTAIKYQYDNLHSHQIAVNVWINIVMRTIADNECPKKIKPHSKKYVCLW